MGGVFSYRLAKLIWSLDLIEDHHERYHEVTCTSDLQVTLINGFCIEMAATLCDIWMSRQIFSARDKMDELMKYMSTSMMIVYGNA